MSKVTLKCIHRSDEKCRDCSDDLSFAEAMALDPGEVEASWGTTWLTLRKCADSHTLADFRCANFRRALASSADPGLTCGALSNDGSACTRLPHSESPGYHTDGTEYCWIGAPGTPAARATLGRLAWSAKPMRPARDDVYFQLSAAGAYSTLCDRLTAAIEQDRREVIEACAKAVEAERLLEPDEDDEGDEAYQHAVNHCARAVRSLSPKGHIACHAGSNE